MKNNDEKIIIFFNMHCDVYYYLHSLKLKFYLCMENKKDKLYYVVKWTKWYSLGGKLNQIIV